MFRKIRNHFARLIVILGGFFLTLVFIIIFVISILNAKYETQRIIKDGLSFPSFNISDISPNGVTDTILIFIDEENNPIYETNEQTNETHVKYLATNGENNEWFQTVADKIAKEKNGEFSLRNKYYYFDSIPHEYLKPYEKCVKYVIYDYTSQRNNIITLGWSLSCGLVITWTLLIYLGLKIANKAVKPIEETFLKQKELITNASHELKTPVTVINTNLAVLELNKEDTIVNQEHWINNISEQTKKMNYLICQMLDLARTDTLLENETKSYLNLSEIVNKLILVFETRAFDKNILLESKVDNNIYFIANHDNIEKVFSILIDNALKYCNKNGYINITLQQNRREIIFTISNTGKGIKKENIDKIFQRFYRQDESYDSENNNSFGLGLSIAKSIIDHLKGTIKVQSEENKLTTFKVTFNKK